MSNDAVSTIQRAIQARENQKKKRPTPTVPSHRDQQIFQRVVVNCELQSAIASELGLTRGRVSQIISRVRHWLGQGCQGDPALLSQLERKRLQRSLAQARQENIYKLSIREFTRQSQNPKHTTIRTETKPNDGDSPTPDPRPLTPSKVVTTIRDQAPSVQLLKIAQRSAIEMQRLAELEPLPEPQPLSSSNAAPDDDSIRSALFSLLWDLRVRAENEGRVIKSTDLYALVRNFLSAFLGVDEGNGGGFFELDDAIRQVVRKFVISPCPVYPPAPEPAQFVEDTLARSASEGNSRCEPEQENPTNHLNTPKPNPAELTKNNPPSRDVTPCPAATSAPQSPRSAKPTTPQKPPKFTPPPPGMVMFGPYIPPAPDDPISIATHPWTRPS